MTQTEVLGEHLLCLPYSTTAQHQTVIYGNNEAVLDGVITGIGFKGALVRINNLNDPEEQLTREEIRLLTLHAVGATALQLARNTFISPRTVERHQGIIDRKLRANTSSGNCVSQAVGRGLFEIIQPATDPIPDAFFGEAPQTALHAIARSTTDKEIRRRIPRKWLTGDDDEAPVSIRTVQRIIHGMTQAAGLPNRHSLVLYGFVTGQLIADEFTPKNSQEG